MPGSNRENPLASLFTDFAVKKNKVTAQNRDHPGRSRKPACLEGPSISVIVRVGLSGWMGQIAVRLLNADGFPFGEQQRSVMDPSC